MTRLLVKAYAKVNIGLSVLARRPDGYHGIDSYFHLVDLHDELRLSLEEATATSVLVHRDVDYLEDGVVDLVERAARLYSQESTWTFSLSVDVSKRIPSQAGLGGGSSDAAGMLRALEEASPVKLGQERLMELSLRLGSDVPFFSSGLAAAHVWGRGECFEAISPVGFPVLIVRRPEEKVQTKEAYRLLDGRSSIPGPLPAWTLDAGQWGRLYHNDFDFLQGMRRDEAFKALASQGVADMTTGSGSCQLIVFQDVKARDRAAASAPSSFELIPSFLLSSRPENVLSFC